MSHDRTRAVELLLDHGATGVAHVNGFLFEHLERTETLLRSWGCSDRVAMSGLCHATYGTDGFDVALLTLDRRAELSALVGSNVEEVVYFYASCDRGFLYPRLNDEEVLFKDRFTGETFVPTHDQLQDFVDLTLANECDVGVIGSGEPSPPAWLLSLFNQMQNLASDSARIGTQGVLHDGDR